ncbi:MAG: RICIN domain-containing protein, partial [Oscillospiraceae bacterium]|nr:RICIN domain-containing protein [Oscillospiraceae bacterium]
GYTLLDAYNTKGTDTKDFCNTYSGCFKSAAKFKYITDSDMTKYVSTKYTSPFLTKSFTSKFDNMITEFTASSFKEGSVYMIKNVNSGLYIDVEGAAAANGTNCQQWGASEPGIQNTWKLVSAGDDYYYIVSAVGDGGSYVLDVSGKSSADGANVQIYSYRGTDNQKFKFTKNSDGSYKILTKISGDKSGIEIANAERTSGSNVQQWAINGANCQDWILEPVTNLGCAMDTSVIYEFKNVNSGMVMDITNGKMEEGNNVQQWSSGSFASQQWTLQAFSGGGNYYYIRSAADPSYVLKATSGSNGGNIEIVPYSNKDSMMLFKFSKNIDGSYSIMTRASKDGCLIEIENASISSGAN